MFKSKAFVVVILALSTSIFCYSLTNQNDQNGQYNTLLNNQNQIVSNIIQSQNETLEKQSWEKKLKYVKYAAIGVLVTAALVGGSLFAYYMFNKFSHALQDPTKEELKALDEMEKTSEKMTTNLTTVDEKIKKVSENNQLIKTNLELAIPKIEENKKTIAGIRTRVDERLADLKLVGEALEKLNHTEEELEQLKQSEVMNRKMHKYYVQEAFKLINESKRQKKTVNELVDMINGLKQDIETLRKQQKLLEDKEYLRHDTQSALIGMTFENKKKLNEILDGQRAAQNLDFLKKYIAEIAYKLGLQEQAKNESDHDRKSSLYGLNLANVKK
jgi:hypothetical protein